MKAKLRNEELEQRLRSTESSLKAELDEARRECNHQVDLHQRLETELAHRNTEANTFYARLDTLQVNYLCDKFCFVGLIRMFWAEKFAASSRRLFISSFFDRNLCPSKFAG